MVKALGRGSLSSGIAVALYIVRAILWIALVCVGIAIAFLPIAPFALEWLAQQPNVKFEGAVDIEAGDVVKVLSAFVTIAVMLYVVNRLLEILRTLEARDPFRRDNASRFQRIGYALLINEGMKLVFGVGAILTQQEVDLSINLVSLIPIAAVFVLAEIFLEGARLKEEQDLTV